MAACAHIVLVFVTIIVSQDAALLQLCVNQIGGIKVGFIRRCTPQERLPGNVFVTALSVMSKAQESSLHRPRD
ncbi:hypothetical protein BA177_12410 [Woeseia oceani]|uniref:Uncharacterized protein n=1 Tax=Woeseia oceani TaxID=1548547 RepID=A0A193LHG5_9GAMM|nr:hypothetical protein BA177_12410 [Woeseia oceani]